MENMSGKSPLLRIGAKTFDPMTCDSSELPGMLEYCKAQVKHFSRMKKVVDHILENIVKVEAAEEYSMKTEKLTTKKVKRETKEKAGVADKGVGTKELVMGAVVKESVSEETEMKM